MFWGIDVERLALRGFSLGYGFLSLVLAVVAAAVKGRVFTRNRAMSYEEERELDIGMLHSHVQVVQRKLATDYE